MGTPDLKFDCIHNPARSQTLARAHRPSSVIKTETTQKLLFDFALRISINREATTELRLSNCCSLFIGVFGEAWASTRHVYIYVWLRHDSSMMCTNTKACTDITDRITLIHTRFERHKKKLTPYRGLVIKVVPFLAVQGTGQSVIRSSLGDRNFATHFALRLCRIRAQNSPPFKLYDSKCVVEAALPW
jgi:hypothetical protein